MAGTSPVLARFVYTSEANRTEPNRVSTVTITVPAWHGTVTFTLLSQSGPNRAGTVSGASVNAVIETACKKKKRSTQTGSKKPGTSQTGSKKSGTKTIHQIPKGTLDKMPELQLPVKLNGTHTVDFEIDTVLPRILLHAGKSEFYQKLPETVLVTKPACRYSVG